MPRSTVTSSLLAVCCAVLLSSCVHGKASMSEGCRAIAEAHFWSKPWEQTVADFRGEADLESKYRFYLCGMETIHPPAMYLVEVFAEDGAVAVPFLVSKLQGTDDDVSVLQILWVLERMELLDTYDVVGDAELRELLKEKVKALKDETWKENGERTLERMGIP